MTSINITIGANTAKFQEAITNLQQTVDQTAEKISDSFKSVGKAIEQTKAKWADWASISTGLRNTGRIVQELGSWLRTPLEQFSRFEDAASGLSQIETPPGDPPRIFPATGGGPASKRTRRSPSAIGKSKKRGRPPTSGPSGTKTSTTKTLRIITASVRAHCLQNRLLYQLPLQDS